MTEEIKTSDSSGATANANLSPVVTDWSMFKKETELGEGAYGTVYKVKCLKTSLVYGDSGQRVAMTTAAGANAGLLRRKLNMRAEGINMATSEGKKVRTLMMDQYYVIKVIDTSKMPKESAIEALMEIELLAKLDSHFIVGYFDSFIVDTQINIIMDYCQHHDLCSYIKKQNGKSFVENFVWKVFIHICLGIHYLHSRDIIHRDLKSLNVFLTKDNSAKVGDLGASRHIDENGNIIDELLEGIPQNHKVGTPFYLAPELWQDKPCSKKSDIWALGVILYEMCALQVPFQADEMEALEQKVIKDKPIQLPNSVHKSFSNLIQKCLQKKQEHRPSIEEIILLDDFQAKCKLNRITLPLELNKSKLLKKTQAKPMTTITNSVELLPSLAQIQSTPQTQRDLSIVEEETRLFKRHSHNNSSTSSLSALRQRPLSTFKSQPSLAIITPRTPSSPKVQQESRSLLTSGISQTIFQTNRNQHFNINLVQDVIPECMPKQIIKPQENRTSRLRADLIAEKNAQQTKSENQDSSLPFGLAKNLVAPKSEIKQNTAIKARNSLLNQQQQTVKLIEKPNQPFTAKKTGPTQQKRLTAVQSARVFDSDEKPQLLTGQIRVKYVAPNRQSQQGKIVIPNQIGRLAVTKSKAQNTKSVLITKPDQMQVEQSQQIGRSSESVPVTVEVEDDDDVQMYEEADSLPLRSSQTQRLISCLVEDMPRYSLTQYTPMQTEEDILFEKLLPGHENDPVSDFIGEESLLDDQMQLQNLRGSTNLLDDDDEYNLLD